jgi:hypothetical protein
MLKRVSTRNLLISAAFFAGIVIIGLLKLLHSWENEQFALTIKTKNELNHKSSQIALDSEFQKNHPRAHILGLATFREILQAREDQDEANLRYLSFILDAVKSQIINMALDASLPQRYGLSWETTGELLMTTKSQIP